MSRKQQLVWFHETSPGSAFFLPHATRIYNKLAELVRHECRLRGYEEVMTPLIFRPSLWETSGHWDNYRENMFLVNPAEDPGSDVGEEAAEHHVFGLKPMNCPAHCLMFKHMRPSKRDLPLRLLDLSSLHRCAARRSVPTCSFLSLHFPLWQERGDGRVGRNDASPALPPGRRAHLLHEGADRR